MHFSLAANIYTLRGYYEKKTIGEVRIEKRQASK